MPSGTISILHDSAWIAEVCAGGGLAFPARHSGCQGEKRQTGSGPEQGSACAVFPYEARHDGVRCLSVDVIHGSVPLLSHV